jgi:GntR family transcriptional regulator / MocR family aminotransferase
VTPPRRRATRNTTPAIRLLRSDDVDAEPLHVQVYQQLRGHIMNGTLVRGARLPSARTLASDLRISRNTVDAAFAQLRAEGLIVRRVGAGTVVAETLDDSAPFVPRGDVRPRGRQPSVPTISMPATGAPPLLSARGTLIAALGAAEIASDQHALPCATDVRGFPSATWSTLLTQRARRAELDAFHSADSFGTQELREAIAVQARLTRGVECDARQVVVVNSAQQALDLAARLLLDPGSEAAMEDPCYPGARAALLASGARVIPVAVDDDGIRVRDLASHPAVRLVYVTPSHQYPLGVTMSLERRAALLAWAASTRGWIIEDDYDSEFRYADRPLLSLQGMDRQHRVLYLGTFNKVLFPGLRVAYLILPTALVDAFGAARRVSDGFSPPLLQGVLADFLSRGHFSAYMRAARHHYQATRDALVLAIQQRCGNRVALGPSHTGLHVVAHLGNGVDDRRVAAIMRTQGLGVSALSMHYHGPNVRRGLLMSYGSAVPEAVDGDVRALAAALDAG